MGSFSCWNASAGLCRDAERLTFAGGFGLLNEVVGLVKVLRDVLGLHVGQHIAQVLEPGRRLQILRVIVDRDDPAPKSGQHLAQPPPPPPPRLEIGSPAGFP